IAVQPSAPGSARAARNADRFAITCSAALAARGSRMVPCLPAVSSRQRRLPVRLKAQYTPIACPEARPYATILEGISHFSEADRPQLRSKCNVRVGSAEASLPQIWHSRHMRRIYSPTLLGNVENDRARAFVFLFTCDAFARAILISQVPLQAYALLGAARLVSVAYFVAAFVGLAASLTVPVVLHWIRRRWVLTIGAVIQILSVALLALGTKASLVAGLALQMLAMAVLDVVINLYLLDHIPRRRLNHFEPRRLLFAGAAFAAGPGWASTSIATSLTACPTSWQCSQP